MVNGCSWPSARLAAASPAASSSTRAPAAAAARTLFHIRDGRVVRLDAYFDLGHALADLGLEAVGVVHGATNRAQCTYAAHT